jgi:peptidoglycan hydrolase-like protein with peptidoglycan-binding domain
MKNILIKGLFVSASILLVTSSASAMTCTNLTKTLSKGSENSEVLKLQQFLFDGGYLTAKPNGYFGAGTMTAVKKFQGANGLSQVGSVGPLTRSKVKGVSCGKDISTTANTNKVNVVKNVVTRPDTIKKLQSFLLDWKGKYETDCTGKEMTNECTIWRASIAKLENTCFESNLTGDGVTKCGENILNTAFQSALWSKVADSEAVLASSTKTALDKYNEELAKLPEGKTVKVTSEKATAEYPHATQTTTTYMRTDKSVEVTRVITVEGQSGHLEYKNTVLLK